VLTIRRAEDRGAGHHGWLDSRHTFSFAEYDDPRFIGFHDLRVINEDRVAPGAGFGKHSHEEMEIISYVLEGAIRHDDSTGGRTVLHVGEVQRMSAGTGIAHSEVNASKTDPLHFLQIWILPGVSGLEPGYEQKAFSAGSRTDQLRLIGASDGRDGALTIHQDVDLYASLLSRRAKVEHVFKPNRAAWIQVARGAIDVEGARDRLSIQAGDGLAVEDERTLRLTGREDAEFLLFDLRHGRRDP
jgi:quercetin 2,3-dioxygenase